MSAFLPVLVFLLAEECFQVTAQNLLDGVFLSGTAAQTAAAVRNLLGGDRDAVITALAFLFGLIFVARSAFGEIGEFGRSREEERKSRAGADAEKHDFSAAGAVGTLLFGLGINLLITAVRGMVSDTSSAYASVYNGSFALQICVYGLITPFVEETVFRGLFFLRIRKTVQGHRFPRGLTPQRFAVLLSALVFGVYHGSISQGIYAFLMGCLFAEWYDEKGVFAVPCLLHASMNILVCSLEAAGIYALLCSPLNGSLFTAAGILIMALPHIKYVLPKTKQV